MMLKKTLQQYVHKPMLLIVAKMTEGVDQITGFIEKAKEKKAGTKTGKVSVTKDIFGLEDDQAEQEAEAEQEGRRSSTDKKTN